MNIHFLHGTETGTAEFLCDDLKAEVPDEHTSAISSLTDTSPADLEAGTFYIVVSSTFGSGDVPDTAKSFYEALTEGKPDLSHVSFAIFGLGDMSFGETYNGGSEKLMAALTGCGARMVGERGLFDASTPDMPEDIAVPWMEGLLAELAPA
ncbi:MAG: flavodoxin domain-containing protein [Pseudomonadota bacterium]